MCEFDALRLAKFLGLSCGSAGIWAWDMGCTLFDTDRERREAMITLRTNARNGEFFDLGMRVLIRATVDRLTIWAASRSTSMFERR